MNTHRRFPRQGTSSLVDGRLAPTSADGVKPVTLPGDALPDLPRSEEGPPGAAAPRLLQRLREAVRVRHYSIRTEDAYADWARRFILFHGKRHPRDLGADEVATFLTYLAVQRNVAASTQNQAKSALLFPFWILPIVGRRKLPVARTRKFTTWGGSSSS